MTDERAAKYRLHLLAVLAYQDQLVTEADAVLTDPADAVDHSATREIREMLTDTRANVEYKSDVLTW